MKSFFWGLVGTAVTVAIAYVVISLKSDFSFMTERAESTMKEWVDLDGLGFSARFKTEKVVLVDNIMGFDRDVDLLGKIQIVIPEGSTYLGASQSRTDRLKTLTINFADERGGHSLVLMNPVRLDDLLPGVHVWIDVTEVQVIYQ